MNFNFEKIAKIIEGYFEFLTLIPNFSYLKLEEIKGFEKSLHLAISETRGVIKLTMPIDIYKETSHTETRKTTISIDIFANTEIIKEEIYPNEVKPE